MDNNSHQKEFYEIRIEGQLAPSWSETFDGMLLTQTRRGEIFLSGVVADQAAPAACLRG